MANMTARCALLYGCPENSRVPEYAHGYFSRHL